MKLKLFLSSYDIFTFYKENEEYDDYIITKPKGEDYLGIFNLLGFNNDNIDNNSLIIFRVNKIGKHLESIIFKYNDVEYFKFLTVIMEYELIDKEEFSSAYLVSQCNVIKSKKSILQIIYKELTNLS